VVPDHPLFREQSYHALSRQDAARWAEVYALRVSEAPTSESCATLGKRETVNLQIS